MFYRCTIIAFVFSIVAANAWGVQYTVTDLGALPGSAEGRGNCISNNGQVAGYCNYQPSNNPHAFRYSNGTMSDLGLFSGGTFSRAWGINNSGQVVGEATDASGLCSFLYSNGTMHNLGALIQSSYPSCWAFDINNGGQVVGESASGFIYDSNTGTTTWLPGGGGTHPWGINDGGQVVGYAFNNTSLSYHAFLYNGGTMTDLGTLTGGAGSFAYDLNENKQVVGYAYTASGVGHAFRYSDGIMTDLGTLPGGSWSYGEGINDSGQVVGCSSGAGISGYHAFIYSNGSMCDLNDLIAPTSGWTIEYAEDINNNGWIVGQGRYNGPAGSFEHAVLLTPIPEPSTLVLLGVGAISLLSYGWQRLRAFRQMAIFLLAIVAAFSVAVAQAVTIDLVPVGNPDNSNDSTGYGAVAYNYWIGKYEVTNDQYCEFLNKKANLAYGSNVLGLFNPTMQSSARGGIYRMGSGTMDEPYMYHVKDLMGDKPVGYVSVFDGMRFVNWLNNGAGSSDTENGAYLLLGGTRVPSNATTIYRNPGATVFLPSEDEWYKAAYYEPEHGYWSYGTRSNLPPAWAVADSEGNVANPGVNIANYGYHFEWNGMTGNVSTVGGAGPLSESYYDAADMTGNQAEFTETHWQSNLNQFIFRGGCWGDGIYFQSSSSWAPFDGENDIDPAWGFRVASTVPEPGSMMLFIAGGLCLFAYRWQLQRQKA